MQEAVFIKKSNKKNKIVRYHQAHLTKRYASAALFFLKLADNFL